MKFSNEEEWIEEELTVCRLPDAPLGAALTLLEVQIFDRIVPDKSVSKRAPESIGSYLTKIAKPGGCLARKKNHPR